MNIKVRSHEPLADCFKYACLGVWKGLATQRNLRIHFALAFLAAVLGIAVGLTPLELAVLTLVITFVIAIELVNSAFEATIDLICPDHHPLAGYVKDVAAGAVLVASIGALIVGALLFLPRLIHLIPA